jgi:thioredoxin 1
MHTLNRVLGTTLLLVLSVGLVIAQKNTKHAQESVSVPLMTFVELGSVKCVPCRMMQPVMKNIETKYGNQVKVIFYDIWQEDQKKYAKDYDIRVIPTQVFLDKSGKEVFRHEGFFPESEIDTLLVKHGLKAGA